MQHCLGAVCYTTRLHLLQGFCTGEPQNRDVTDVISKVPQKGPNLALFSPKKTRFPRFPGYQFSTPTSRNQMSAHFLFELGFPPKSLASYFIGVVLCVRNTMSTHANLLCRMAVHSSEFRSQTCPDLINIQIACHMIGYNLVRNAALGENLFRRIRVLRWS